MKGVSIDLGLEGGGTQGSCSHLVLASNLDLFSLSNPSRMYRVEGVNYVTK